MAQGVKIWVIYGLRWGRGGTSRAISTVAELLVIKPGQIHQHAGPILLCQRAVWCRARVADDSTQLVETDHQRASLTAVSYVSAAAAWRGLRITVYWHGALMRDA